MDKNRLAGEYADTYGNMGSDAWNNAYTCYLAGMDACQQLLQQAIEIFNEKANFNKWLLELTESEMSLVIEMMEEYRNQPSDNTQSIDTELAGKIWDAAEEFSNECWCGQCDYCNTVSKRPPDKETFINSLNLDNTQIRDGWVRVQDGLPPLVEGQDYSENVIAWLDGERKIMNYAILPDDYNNLCYAWCMVYNGLDGDAEFDDNYYPSHWQPLPTPPND